MKKLIVIVAALVALTGCTRSQLDAWVRWYQSDPTAAVDYAEQPEVQAAIHRVVEAIERPSGRWDRIAFCESGGNWRYPPVRGGRGQLYAGGLMIWLRAWDAYGGRQFASTPDRASKAQQIIVAERILADRGWGAWDCA